PRAQIRLYFYVSLKQKRLHERTKSLIAGLPNFARACGRVSVGGHPDKRPDSRLRKRTLLPCSRDRQPEANRPCPLSTGDAAQSNDGRAFLVTAGANAGDTERACPSLPTVRNGASPNPDRGSKHGDASASRKARRCQRCRRLISAATPPVGLGAG